MPDFGIYAGDTNKTIYVRLRDSTTGLAKTGLAYNSAGALLSYVLPLAARAAITLATQTVTGAHSDGGFVEVDATNCKGLYRVDLSDAAIASGDFTIISIEFDGIIEESLTIPLHVPDVNLLQMGGSAQSATDLKDFADDGYNPATNKVTGVLLVDTTTTNTDMVGTDSAATAAELAKVPKSDGTASWNATALAAIQGECDTACDTVTVTAMATNVITADAAAADFIGASEIAASASTEIANLIAGDWVAGDASPLAIVAALKADAEWVNMTTIATTADLLDKLGAVNEAAAAGDPSATESVMQYVKQIVNILTGTAGIATMPAAAAPANAVSIAEMVRAIYDDTNELQADDVPTLIAGVVTDLDDIKGTGFVKDTHSLIDIETYVDILDDGTSGNAKIATDVAAVLVDTGTTIPGTITTIDTEVGQIKAKTDLLQFTATNYVQVDLQYLNAIQLTGTGASGDEWGPV